MAKKIARFLKEIPFNAHGWWVIQYVFKVDPPMEWEEYVTTRNGKILIDRSSKSLLHGAKHHLTGRYRYFTVNKKTSFVVASASDLKTMMASANAKMRQKAMEAGDMATVELFKDDSESIVSTKPEVYLFACDKYGKWKSNHELPGSQRGTMDHRLPFLDEGYEVIGMPEVPREIRAPNLPRKPLILRAEIEL